MYDDKFLDAVETVLKHEGGYVWDKVDLGGETNFGISKRSYPNEDIKNMTRDRAIKIYFDDYWKRGGYDKIDDVDVSAKVFDASINMGRKRANKLLQKALNHMGESLVVDGIIGQYTLATCNKCNNIILLDKYKDEMMYFYNKIIRKNPAMSKYRNGWAKRAYS